MGQKVNPNGLRLGINKDWEAKWYAGKKDFAKTLKQDVLIREYFEKNMKNAGIAKVEIERNAKRCEVTVHTSKPGVMLGKGGEEIEILKIEKKITLRVKKQMNKVQKEYYLRVNLHEYLYRKKRRFIKHKSPHLR